jgi:hypothetical protein
MPCAAENSDVTNVALLTPQKSATFRDIRDMWSTPFFRATGQALREIIRWLCAVKNRVT